MDVPRQINREVWVLKVGSYLHVQEMSLPDAGESRGGLSEYGHLLLKTMQTDCGSIGSHHWVADCLAFVSFPMNLAF